MGWRCGYRPISVLYRTVAAGVESASPNDSGGWPSESREQALRNQFETISHPLCTWVGIEPVNRCLPIR